MRGGGRLRTLPDPLAPLALATLACCSLHSLFRRLCSHLGSCLIISLHPQNLQVSKLVQWWLRLGDFHLVRHVSLWSCDQVTPGDKISTFYLRFHLTLSPKLEVSHHCDRFDAYRSWIYNAFILLHYFTWLHDWRDMWLGQREPLNLSHHCNKFDALGLV